MLNQVVLVGRLTSDPEIVTMENGKKMTSITIAVQRAYKNMDGLYETDFIRCILWNGVASSTHEYCRCGDVVGVKGRLQTRSYEKDDEKKYVMEVIADKVTFLSSNKKTEEVNESSSKDKKGE
ncbi:MAG: single-stranded DNA-binding protein [Bacilli bacterium]|nr:single-stranded DNA-binding protein [Bacilli bacterium]